MATATRLRPPPGAGHLERAGHRCHDHPRVGTDHGVGHAPDSRLRAPCLPQVRGASELCPGHGRSRPLPNEAAGVAVPPGQATPRPAVGSRAAHLDRPSPRTRRPAGPPGRRHRHGHHSPRSPSPPRNSEGPPSNGLRCFDGCLKVTEDWHGELWPDDTDTITTYQRVWQALSESAVFGAETQHVIARARGSLDALSGLRSAVGRLEPAERFGSEESKALHLLANAFDQGRRRGHVQRLCAQTANAGLYRSISSSFSMTGGPTRRSTSTTSE